MPRVCLCVCVEATGGGGGEGEEGGSLPSSNGRAMKEVYCSSTTTMLGGGEEELGEISEEEGVWVEARGRQMEAVA